MSWVPFDTEHCHIQDAATLAFQARSWYRHSTFVFTWESEEERIIRCLIKNEKKNHLKVNSTINAAILSLPTDQD